MQDVGDMDLLRLPAQETTADRVLSDERDATTAPAESDVDTVIRRARMASARVACSSSATLASASVDCATEPLIREATL